MLLRWKNQTLKSSTNENERQYGGNILNNLISYKDQNFFLLHFRFWGTCEGHARLLHKYIHSNVVCCLHPHHLYLSLLPMLSLPNSLPLTVPPQPPPTDPSVWCSPPCVPVFSLFNTCLSVRTCGVWFSVLVLVCWEWRFPGSSIVPTKDTNSSFLMAA